MDKSKSSEAFSEAVAETVAKDHVSAKERFSNARQLAAEKIDQLRTVASEKAEAVKVHAAELRTQASVKYDQARSQAIELHAAAEEQVKAKPTQSMLIAAGAGFVMGILFGALISRR